ncbi:MAG: helix-turn-helix domain-containing protein [Sulfobacillus sp.]
MRRGRPIDPDQRYLSPRQTARVLGVSEALVYTEIHSGQIPHRTLGGRILIPLEWIQDFSRQST